TGQIALVCFTHATLSVLFTIHSQLILRELFYTLPDFSNNLLNPDFLYNRFKVWKSKKIKRDLNIN
ncbi:MAG: hypothetical protein NHB32_02235, partial [Fischerella sp. CENA71]|nr:hypothetical protein [Fischerella sp. CENA71]